MATRPGPSPGSARIVELKRAEADIHRELERLQGEEQARQAGRDPPPGRQTVAPPAAGGEQGGEAAGEGGEMPSPEVVLDLVWKVPLQATGRRPPSRARGGQAYESRVFRAGSAAEKMARLEVRILGEQAAALGSLEAEARYREAVAHVALLEKAACITAVGDELDCHDKAASMAKDATRRKQAAFRQARKRFEEEMAAAFRERDAIIAQAKEKVRKWKAAASGAPRRPEPRRPEPQRPSKQGTELKWKGSRAEAGDTEVVRDRGEGEKGGGGDAAKQEEQKKKEEAEKEEKRKQEQTRRQEARPSDVGDQVSREPPCEPLPPFDELAEDERFEDARGPASGSFEPEQSPGMVAAIAGATAAAAEAVYEVTADTVTAPVRVVEELVAHPVQTVKEVVTAPVAIVEDLLVAPLLGRRDEQVGGEAGGQPRSGVQERVHEYEQRTAPTGRPTAGRPSSPGRRSGESSPEAWEVIEKNGVGVKGAGAEASDAGEGPPSRGRERRPTEGTTGDSAQGPRPFAWGRKEEAAERSAQKGDGSEQRSPVPAAP